MKHEIEIKHEQTYRLYVNADDEHEAKMKAKNIILNNGTFKIKYLTDDHVQVKVINLMSK